MSTILKALRRLEEDASATTSDTLPATDPRAADELRDRILAEEFAAQASVDAQRDPSRSRRIAILSASGLVLLLVGLVGVRAYLMKGDEPDSSAESKQVAVAAAPAPRRPTPVPVASPKRAAIPSEAAAKPNRPVAVAAAIPSAANDQTITSPTAPSLVSAPTSKETAAQPAPAAPAVAVVAAKAETESVSPAPRVEQAGTRADANRAAATPEAPSQVDEKMAIAAVTPTPARAAADAGRPARTPKTSQREEPAPRRRARPPIREKEPQAPSVSASLPAPTSSAIPEDRPGSSRPSSTPREPERAVRPSLPDVTIVRTDWHPRPTRRSAKIRLEDTKEILTLREGDAVGALVIQEISPSAVLFKSGEVEIRRRVGQGGAGN